MIVGVGVDLIEVARVQRALENSATGRRFRDRVYTEREIEYCEGRGRGKYESYAGRFAAKEAVMKALGRGWGSKVGWLDIEVLSSLGGKPEIRLHDNARDYARKLGIQSVILSITHMRRLALAFVIAQGE